MSESSYTADMSPAPRSTTVEVGYIHPLQAGKVLAVLYAFFSLLLIPFLLLSSLAAAQQNGGAAIGVVAMSLFMMILYPIGGFLLGVIGGALYNIVVKMVGGIRIDLK